ncbi:MAG: stage V sporulation protein AD [Eubacteriales bacterium]|nr:stage V sporulation protein AD [Eubacteriales bacterium]
MARKIGKQTYQPENPPVIISTAAVVGPFEGQGPLQPYFDHIYTDMMAGERSFEAAEREMALNACWTCMNKAGKTPQEVDFFLAGDLLNQITTSAFSAVELAIPYLGIYGACSSSGEGLALATMLVDGGYANLVLAATSSHNATAERQYRYPTEYGSHRKPTTQWTVTGAGAALVAPGGTGDGPQITMFTVGKLVDLGIKDVQNVGAAMAPAAADTLVRHFADTGRSPGYYDLIVTGDLGKFGKDLTKKLAVSKGGFDLSDNYEDCGLILYDTEKQDVHAGASGCASSAVVVYGYLYRQLMEGQIRRLLMVPTGALHSPTSFQQGDNIPGIAHASSIEKP